ncbi:hypothetical protein T01_10917, partial [Trichinella spiralis]
LINNHSYREFCEETASECRRCDIGFYGIKVDGTEVQSGNDTHLQELIKYTSKVAIYKSPEIQNEVVAIIATENFVK